MLEAIITDICRFHVSARFVFSTVSFSRHLRLPGSKPSSDMEISFNRYTYSKGLCSDSRMPGIGKTSTMVHAVKALLTRGSSVLLSSCTKAVDNLLIKLKTQGISLFWRLSEAHPQTISSLQYQVGWEVRGPQSSWGSRCKGGLQIGESEEVASQVLPLQQSHFLLNCRPRKTQISALENLPGCIPHSQQCALKERG
ncbi:hypothetical protein NE237_030314 [Protea cynaroides]|uniref:DNA2/NAM7 helicase helicase domain-containing protein n=1 Tax=Protea cynaroides TaxID=273540 RepID=A0A9Q0GST3_9MAGN|nr:hypothetical protein NE237_030314 [Protea cynaroides]